MTHEVAWAAGLFEGEGAIWITKRDSLLRIRLSSTDLDVLQRFHAAVGVGYILGPYKPNGSKTPEGRKLIYNWETNRLPEIAEVLDAFRPFLGERRKARMDEVFALYRAAPIKRHSQWTFVDVPCDCGCGGTVSKTSANSSRQRFIWGHGGRGSKDWEGDVMTVTAAATWDSRTHTIQVTGAPTAVIHTGPGK